MRPILLKLTFIPGLKEVVLEEIKLFSKIKTIKTADNSIYIETSDDTFKSILSLKSVTSAYIVKQDSRYNPKYINKHKSSLGELIEIVLKENPKKIKNFRLRCAGSQSNEIQEIKDYIKDTYKIKEADESDLEIYINKLQDIWEISVRLSTRPLSLRDYKEKNIKGGLNPTVAYTMNSFCDLKNISSYLNIFSGSGTLLIEAGLVNPKIKLLGFDIDNKSNTHAIQNIKKAGLIKNIEIKSKDIFNEPDFGKFDAITANLPFGMQIYKNEDLGKLYQTFVNYSESILNPKGKLIIYTTELNILENMLKKSKFKILKTLDLTISTSVNSYIHPKVYICNLL